MRSAIVFALLLLSLVFFSCQEKAESVTATDTESSFTNWSDVDLSASPLLSKYTPFTLETDMSLLSDNQKKMINILLEAADIMDELFWYDAYGDKDELLGSIDDASLKSFALINYGPWDRLGDNEPFVEGVGVKPAGANFYPKDMTPGCTTQACDFRDSLASLKRKKVVVLGVSRLALTTGKGFVAGAGPDFQPTIDRRSHHLGLLIRRDFEVVVGVDGAFFQVGEKIDQKSDTD